MIEQHESQYQSYLLRLLRLWRAGEGKSWRVMLEHVRTCERYGFSDLEGLCTFLREQMDEQEEERGIGEIRFTGGNAPTKTGGTSPKKAGGTSPKILD